MRQRNNYFQGTPMAASENMSCSLLHFEFQNFKNFTLKIETLETFSGGGVENWFWKKKG